MRVACLNISGKGVKVNYLKLREVEFYTTSRVFRSSWTGQLFFIAVSDRCQSKDRVCDLFHFNRCPVPQGLLKLRQLSLKLKQ